MKIFRKFKGLYIFYILILIIVWKLFNNYRRSFKDVNIPKPSTTENNKYCSIPVYKNFIRQSEDGVLLKNLQCPNNSEVISIFDGKLNFNINWTCTFICIDWSSDFNYRLSGEKLLINQQSVPCQYFHATCRHQQSGEIKNQLIFKGIKSETIIRNSKSLLNGLKKPRDVLILGIDSLSYNAYKHYLPKTYSLLHDDLEGVSFTKFNTMGDGTTVNLQALLTGTKDTETYESRRRISGAKPVDNYNWIWNHFKKHGYLTQYYEEMTDYGTFQYRLLGFEKQPTDIYLRTFLMYAERNKFSKNFCLASKPQHREILRFHQDITKENREVPIFSFIYFSLASHDNNQYASYLDDDVAEFLRETRQLNPETFIILYADHGHRFNSRQSMQGKYEERLPFLGISLPSDLKHLKSILEVNSEILLTGLDVHATLEDILGIYKPSIRSRHMSLLRPLPPDRSCSDIESAAHWCACLRWTEIPTPNLDKRFVAIADTVSRQIANFTANERDLCAPLTLDSIVSLHKMDANEEVLKYKKSADVDGFVPDLSDQMKQSHIWFRLVLKTKPGDGLFEVTLSVKTDDYHSNNGKVVTIETIRPDDVSRINRFSPWIKCLTNNIANRKSTVSDIRKFCICQNAL